MIASLKGYGKIARTLLLVLGCLLAIGIVGSLFLGVRAKSQAKATAVEQAVAIADNSLALTFEPSDLTGPVDSTRALELTQRIEEVVVDPTDFDEVTLYSPEGLILYSTVESSIGLQQDGEQDRIREALKGIAQTRSVDGTFQVMLPLRFRSGEGGPAVVELSRSDTPIAQASGPWNTIAMFLFALLVILSVAVFGVARVLSVVSTVPEAQAAAAARPQPQQSAPQARMSSPGLREEGEARRRAEERAKAAEQRLNVLQEQYRKALEDLRAEQQASSQRTPDPRLEERAIRAEGQLERLMEQVRGLTMEREELASELDAAHRAAAAASTASAHGSSSSSSSDTDVEVIGLRSELERAEEQLEMTRREVDLLRGQSGATSREEFDAMRRDLGRARDAVSAAEARAEQAEHEREETRTELRGLRNEEQRAAMLEDELRAAKAEIESFRASHRADLVEREAEFEEKVRATREEFQRQLEDIEGSYRSQLGQRESELANRITTAETSARAAVRELESAKGEVEAARAEAASREQRVLEAADELAARRGEIASLQQEIQERTLAVSQARKETDDLKRSLVGLQADLVRADGAVDTMKAELETERTRATENEDASAQATRDRRAFEERVQKLTHMLEEAAAENAELNRRLQDFEARRQLELADDAGRSEIDDLLRVTQERLAGQTEKLIAAEDRVKELEAESVTTKEKLDLAEADLRTHQMSEALKEMREPTHAEAAEATEAAAAEAVEDRRSSTPFTRELSNDATKTISRITGIAQLLKHKKDTKDQAALIKQLNAYARRLDYTVADIADADKLARGTIALQPKKLDLDALINRLVEESGIASDHEVRVITDPVKIRLDAQRTEQIVAGLLRNAGERTPSSKSIVVRLQNVDGGATISVEDPEPSSDASMSPVVRRFAEVQGGWAKVESREGGGSIFRVHLPNSMGPDGATAAATSPELQIMVEAPQNGVVEDPWEPSTAEQILSRELRRLAELPSEER